MEETLTGRKKNQFRFKTRLLTFYLGFGRLRYSQRRRSKVLAREFFAQPRCMLSETREGKERREERRKREGRRWEDTETLANLLLQALVETVEWSNFCAILMSHLSLSHSPAHGRRCDSPLVAARSTINNTKPNATSSTFLSPTSSTPSLSLSSLSPSPSFDRSSSPHRKPEDDKRMTVLRHFLIDTEISLMSSRGPCVSMVSLFSCEYQRTNEPRTN